MYEAIDFKVQGVSPLLMHNGRLANPLDPFAKELKGITSKRNKTDADHVETSRIEFLGGLYTDELGRPVIPGENIEAMLIVAAKKVKLGPKAKAGIMVDGLFPVEYDGPKSPDALWADKRFVDIRGAKLNGKTTIMRTRAIFRAWRLSFRVQFLPDQLNRREVESFVKVAGQSIGLGDYKPKFGRFEVV